MAGDDLVRGLRLRAQRLEPRSREGAAAVVRDVCGVQAQDARAAALSVRARGEGLTAAGVTGAPGLVRTWAWRGTLHLLAVEDLAWVLPLVAPGAMRGVRARWRQLRLDERTYARARDAVAAAVARGPLTRAQLRDALADAGVDASGQRLPHLLRRAALEGLLHHPLDDTFAGLEPPPPRPAGGALAELARRYLAAYAPAGPRDLAAWSGLPAADVQAAWSAVADELVPVDNAWALDGELPEPAGSSVRLLGAFDTYLLGYQSRDLAVAREHARRVSPGGGWLHPVLLVDGRAAGTWRIVDSRVDIEPFEPLPPALGTVVEAEVADVERFLAA